MAAIRERIAAWPDGEFAGSDIRFLLDEIGRVKKEARAKGWDEAITKVENEEGVSMDYLREANPHNDV